MNSESYPAIALYRMNIYLLQNLARTDFECALNIAHGPTYIALCHHTFIEAIPYSCPVLCDLGSPFLS